MGEPWGLLEAASVGALDRLVPGTGSASGIVFLSISSFPKANPAALTERNILKFLVWWPAPNGTHN